MPMIIKVVYITQCHTLFLFKHFFYSEFWVSEIREGLQNESYRCDFKAKKSILSNNVHSYMSLNIEVNDYLNIILVACNLICSAESSVTYIYKSIQIEWS